MQGATWDLTRKKEASFTSEDPTAVIVCIASDGVTLHLVQPHRTDEAPRLTSGLAGALRCIHTNDKIGNASDKLKSLS